MPDTSLSRKETDAGQFFPLTPRLDGNASVAIFSLHISINSKSHVFSPQIEPIYCFVCCLFVPSRGYCTRTPSNVALSPIISHSASSKYL